MVGEETKFINDAFEKEDPHMKATVKLEKLTKVNIRFNNQKIKKNSIQ